MKRALTIAALAASLLALTVSPAGAKKKQHVRTIASPRAGQTLSGTINVRPSVKAKRGRYTVVLKVDSKVRAKRKRVSRRSARKKFRINTRTLTNGVHRLTITVSARSKPRRASQTIKIRVKNSPPPTLTPVRPLYTYGWLPTTPAPTNNPANFTLKVSENFDKPAPLGSFDPDAVLWGTPVYTGSSGTEWLAYLSSSLDTWNKYPYRAKEVLSVHDDVLDFWLHEVDGKPAGASISPKLSPGGTQFQTYGRYSVRMRVTDNIPEYNFAAMLWPTYDSDYFFAESDFPETYLYGPPQVVHGYAHYGPAHENQLEISTAPISLADWHVFTQEWTPDLRRFYLDGVLVAESTADNSANPPVTVWSDVERWQLQAVTTELARLAEFGITPDPLGGHLLIDWAAVWAYTPGSPAD
jgi:hypothetical protein